MSVVRTEYKEHSVDVLLLFFLSTTMPVSAATLNAVYDAAPLLTEIPDSSPQSRLLSRINEHTLALL